MSVDLEEILAVSDQQELWQMLPVGAQIEAKFLGKDYRRQDICESAERFVEAMFHSSNLSFAGVYINDKLRISAWLDKNSDVVSFENAINLDDPGLLKLSHPKRVGDKLAVPLSFKGTNYGVAIFSSENFTSDSAGVLLDCCYDFSQHINNVGEIPILRGLVNTDFLTGIDSRRKLEHDYLQFMENWRNRKQDFGVIFADIDKFHDLNAAFGHAGGDNVLRNIGKIIKGAVRPTDLIGRFGGEEFLFLLNGASPADTEEIARRICDAVRAYRFIAPDGREMPEVTLSVGHVSSAEEGIESDDFINIANRKMLLGKGYGRDVIVSNIKFDIQTGIAGMASFLPNLESQILQCNRSFGNADLHANTAVLIFDIVHFSELIQRLGNKHAWDVFSDYAKWFFSERHNFDYVARVYNRDNMIVSLTADMDPSRFCRHVREIAADYLQKLSTLNLHSNGTRLTLDYAVGGIVYCPFYASEELLTKPGRMFRLAMSKTRKACERPDRMLIEYYQPAKQYQDPSSRQKDLPAQQTLLV